MIHIMRLLAGAGFLSAMAIIIFIGIKHIEAVVYFIALIAAYWCGYVLIYREEK
jgi:hypothetical protein